MFLLAGCGAANQPPLNLSEAIRLAKDVAKQLSSPPRINDIGMSGNGKESQIQLWPDEPGSKVGAYQAGAGYSLTDTGYGPPPTAPMTFTTSAIASNDGGVDVAFQNTWDMGGGSKQPNHSWRFHVGNDRQVTFNGEEGDRLPAVPK